MEKKELKKKENVGEFYFKRVGRRDGYKKGQLIKG